ncbi:ATP-binding protein [Marispirochaeta sp.]|uniref:ATP-binding protein n=1 Tax=Marispirochaeta sp. TaxID=2038653 RepID=UPI0029C94381|nr:ATP-binding protein [Marispirochaeta sp.]
MILRHSNLIRGFLFYLLILTLIVAVFVFGIVRFFSAAIFQQVESELKDTALMLKGLLFMAEERDRLDYDAFCKAAGKSGDTRITVIAADGKVLGDSHAEIESMNNHGDRPEVRYSMKRGSGTAIRHSASVGYRMMYLAISVKTDTGTHVLRVSRSVEAVDEVISRTNRTVLLISLFFLILALFAAVRTGQWIRRPLRRLVDVASRLETGDLDARSDVGYPEEFRVLGHTLNAMARSLAKRMETVQRQRDEYQSVLSGMSEAVIVLDKSLQIVDSNPAAERIFLRTRNEMLSKPLLHAVRNLHLQKVAEELFSGSGPMSAEFPLTFSAGGERSLYLQVHGALIPNGESGQPRAVLVFTDITGIKRSEQVRKDFVSNVSHELKTPITSIKGFVETLIDGAAEDREVLSRFLGIIAKQADNMHAIIEDLLQLSRLDEQSLLLEDSPVEIELVLRNAFERVRESARSRKIRLEQEPGAGCRVRGNQGLLEQAVFNLLDNAVKYSEPGGEISAGVRVNEAVIELFVKDRGVGIPAEDLPRVFERFYRVDKARSRETGGTGLGLAIVKHIALVHGGTVSVDSTPGEGSLFTITLPLGDSAYPEGST